MKDLKIITVNDLEDIKNVVYNLESSINYNQDYDKYNDILQELLGKIDNLIYEIDN